MYPQPMRGTVGSLVIAFAGYSLLNVAQAGQKIGLARHARNKTWGATIWIVATIGTSVAFAVVLAAISLGSVSLVGAMAGTGLVSLAVFSHFVMHEAVDLREIVSLIVVVAGAVLIGVFADETRNAGDSVRVRLLWAILLAGSLLYSLLWLITRRMRYVGAVVGGFSGFLGAYSQLFQEYGTESVSVASGLGAFMSSIITNPITLVWAGLSVASMVVVQFAYRHGRAIEIIPSFTGNFIVIPVIGGVVVFGQNLLAVQWVGVAMITIGSLVLGRGEVETAAAARRKKEIT